MAQGFRQGIKQGKKLKPVIGKNLTSNGSQELNLNEEVRSTTRLEVMRIGKNNRPFKSASGVAEITNPHGVTKKII